MKKIYLMRHSIAERLNLPTEELPLSAEGRALALEKKELFKNITKCYTSPYKRAVETAGLIADEAEVLNHLRERVIGEETEGFWLRQYEDYNYHAKGGESLNQVKRRMEQTLSYIIDHMGEGEEVLIISHAAAICSYLLNYCTLEVTKPENKSRRIRFKNEIILDGPISPADYFILEFDLNRLSNIRFMGSFST